MWARMKHKAKMHGATNGKQLRHASFAAIPLSLLLNLPPEYPAYLLPTMDNGEAITLLMDRRMAPLRCGGDDGNIVRIDCNSQSISDCGMDSRFSRILTLTNSFTGYL